MANKKKTVKKTTTKKVKKEEVVELEEIKEEKPKKETEKKCNFKTIAIVAVCILAFVGISLLLPSNGEKKEKNNTYDVTQWLEDVQSKEVVTVIASTTCPHCQEYKPVITSLSQEHDFNLYFFEIEELSEDEKNTVLTTFDLKDFDGGVPYTFIVKDGKVAGTTIGFANQENTEKFLKENKIIK